MKLGVIAGNRSLPLLVSQRIKQETENKLIAFAFYGETSKAIERYADKVYWMHVGELTKLRECLCAEGIRQCLMAGQISPLRIFNRKHWDKAITALVSGAGDFRPHTIFSRIIEFLAKDGITFLDLTLYLKNDLADPGSINKLSVAETIASDIDFGLGIISGYVELDVGQTVVVKSGSVACLESLEGTDRAIKRAYRIAGKGCTVLKFSKSNQDMRFDVPVVGVSTLRLLCAIKAASLVLQKGRVIILEKEKFISLSRQWKIPVFGSGLIRH